MKDIFLEDKMPLLFQKEILHYQLSPEHVLVDDHNCCKLIGFGFKEHILQREMFEEDEGVGNSYVPGCILYFLG